MNMAASMQPPLFAHKELESTKGKQKTTVTHSRLSSTCLLLLHSHLCWITCHDSFEFERVILKRGIGSDDVVQGHQRFIPWDDTQRMGTRPKTKARQKFRAKKRQEWFGRGRWGVGKNRARRF